MQASLESLLLITSTVILVGVCIGFAVTIFEQNLGATGTPQLNRIRDLANQLLNQTNSLNQTLSDFGVETPSPSDIP